MEVVAASALQYLCVAARSMLQRLCCKTSATHPLMLQLGVLRCTMMRHIPRCHVSHGGAARRVAPLQMGRCVAVSPPRGPRAASLPAGARCCANGHHQRKHRHGRDGVADRSGDGGDNVRSDRRLEHGGGDEHGQLVLPLEYREADIQRRRLEVERRIGVEHVCGMLLAIAPHLVAGARSIEHRRCVYFMSIYMWPFVWLCKTTKTCICMHAHAYVCGCLRVYVCVSPLVYSNA